MPSSLSEILFGETRGHILALDECPNGPNLAQMTGTTPSLL